MKLHYLEIVTSDINTLCGSYEAIYAIKFGEPDELLGGAKTSTMPDGSLIGVRQPLRDDETPVIRPYFLVEDIHQAIKHIAAKGAQIAMPPLEIPSKGTFAIYIIGGVEQGFWQL